MMRLHVGASLERPPTKGYAKHLQFAELRPRPPRPKPSTLGRWARELPDAFGFALMLPLDVVAGPGGWLGLGEQEDDAFTWIKSACEAMKPRAIVVKTGRELTTGQQNRDRLQHYFGRLETPGALQVWSPSGLWEGETLERMAEKLGVIAAVDPLSSAPRPAQTVYAQVRGLGERSRMGDGLLLDLLDRLDACGCQEAMVSIDSKGAPRQARRLMELAIAEGIVAAPEESGPDNAEV